MSHLLPGGSVSVDRKQFSCSDLHLRLDGAFSSAWWWPCDHLFTPILGHCWDSAALGVWLLGRKETQLSVQKALNYYIRYIHVRGSCAFIYRNITYCKTLGTPAISSHKRKEPHQARRAICFKLFLFHSLGELCPGGERELAECDFGSIASLWDRGDVFILFWFCFLRSQQWI